MILPSVWKCVAYCQVEEPWWMQSKDSQTGGEVGRRRCWSAKHPQSQTSRWWTEYGSASIENSWFVNIKSTMLAWHVVIALCIYGSGGAVPLMAGWIFGHQPGVHSRPLRPRLHTLEIQDHCLSPSSQVWYRVGEQGRIDSSTTAWSLVFKNYCWPIPPISAKHF